MGLFGFRPRYHATSKTVLVFGPGPHPDSGRPGISGATIRVRHFAQPLEELGFDVQYHLLDQATESESLPPLAGSDNDHRTVQSFGVEDFQRAEAHLKILKQNKTEKIRAIIGVGSLMPDAVAAQFAQRFSIPFWCDFNGDPLSEWQAANGQNLEAANFEFRDQIWIFVRRGLARGDMFSGVTKAQCNGMLGQLLLTGRATEPEDATRRICHIPNAVPERWVEPPELSNVIREKFQLSERTVCIALTGNWTGWMDVAAMVDCCRRIVKEFPDAKILNRIFAVNEEGRRMESDFNDLCASNFSPDQIIALQKEDGISEHDVLSVSQTAVLCDRDIPESVFGSRNRVLLWLRYPMIPVLGSHSEIARELFDRDLAVDAGKLTPSPSSATPSLFESAPSPLGLCDKNMLQEQQRLGMEFLSGVTYGKTTEALQRWIENPTRWPESSCKRLQQDWADSDAGPVKLFPRDF